MKTLFLTFLILTFAIGKGSCEPIITVADLDSLRLTITPKDAIAYLQSRITYAKDILRERKWEIITAHYRFLTTKKELELLSIEAANLKKIYDLNVKLSRKGEITDIELLNSHNAYLAKESARIRKIAECRELILKIARLCLSVLEFDRGKNADAKKETHSHSNR